MPRPSSRSAAIELSWVCISSFFPAIAASPARRPGSHQPYGHGGYLRVAVVVVLFAGCGIANAQPVAVAQTAVTSKSDRIERFVAEAALRFGIPAFWIEAVIHAESRGAVGAVSPKGAMGLMQIMPQTWADLRSRYGLGADPFDPHDNVLAGAAYLRELHDRYGAAGFLAVYNAGPERYEDHLASGRPLPLETQAYVAGLSPLLREDGLAPSTFVTAILRSWNTSPLFPVRANERLEHRSHVIRRRRQTSIHGKSSDRLDGPRAAVRRAVCGGVGARARGYEALSVSSAVGWAIAISLSVDAGEGRRPTHGRQGKRPARGPAHVVGKIEDFANCRQHSLLALSPNSPRISSVRAPSPWIASRTLRHDAARRRSERPAWAHPPRQPGRQASRRPSSAR